MKVAYQLVAIGLFTVLAPQGRSQASGPTIEETGKFIVSKLDGSVAGGDIGSDGHSRIIWRTSISIQNCLVITQTRGTYTKVNEDTHINETLWDGKLTQDARFDAKDLVVSSVEISEISYWGHLTPTNYYLRIPLADHRDGKMYQLEFHLLEEPLAIRLQKAFISLGRSCGAKDEPF